MRGTPLTPNESVESLRRAYERDRALGMDHASAVHVQANKHGLSVERVEFFCPAPAHEQRTADALALVG